MQENDIKENIRFFKPNDPYYYEVDNLPLIDLLNNDKILRDEINLILTADSNYASEDYVLTNLQDAIGNSSIVDIDGDGVTPPYTDILSWITAQGYLTEVATNLGDLKDVDLSSNTPAAGNTLIYDGQAEKWVTGAGGTEIVWLTQPVFYFSGMEYGNNQGTLNGEGSTGTTYTSTGGKGWNNVNGRWYDSCFNMKHIVSAYPDSTMFKFRRSYASMNLPDNVRSLILSVYLSDMAKTSSGGDRADELMIQNSPYQYTFIDGNSDYAWNTLLRVYSNGGGAPLQAQAIEEAVEVFMGPVQDTSKELEIKFACTAWNVQSANTNLYPKASIMITGYTTY